MLIFFTCFESYQIPCQSPWPYFRWPSTPHIGPYFLVIIFFEKKHYCQRTSEKKLFTFMIWIILKRSWSKEVGWQLCLSKGTLNAKLMNKILFVETNKSMIRKLTRVEAFICLIMVDRPGVSRINARAYVFFKVLVLPTMEKGMWFWHSSYFKWGYATFFPCLLLSIFLNHIFLLSNFAHARW